MELTKGVITRPQKVCIYGPEGIGKTYLASRFPNPVFIDTEGGTSHFDVVRTPEPSSWTMLLEQVKYFKANPSMCSTLIIDSADWGEKLCAKELCATAKKDGIEGFGYGKGFTYLAEKFGELLNELTELIKLGINPVMVAHATMRKVEQPEEAGAYDHWEMKLTKFVGPMVREWADMVLFCNYKTYVYDADGQGTSKGKNKAQGGKRVMYTTHTPFWDAKNRDDLKDELPLDFDEIKHCIPVRGTAAPVTKVDPPKTETQTDPDDQLLNELLAPPVRKTETKNETVQADWSDVSRQPAPNVPKALADLMKENSVTIDEIYKVVANRGYYPLGTPIDKFDPGFIDGVLVGAWEKVFDMIKDIRNEVPL